MENSKKLITIFLSTVLLFGCGPSPEEIAKQEKEQERLAEEARLLEQKKAELEALGNWGFGFYIDEFGDETNEAFVSQTVRGTFSNTATSGSALRVKMYISVDDDGNTYQPFFRLYEYDRSNPMKGKYPSNNQFASNNLACNVKLPDNEIDRYILAQSEGDDYFTILQSNINTLFNMLSGEQAEPTPFEKALADEGKVSFACEKQLQETTKYQFRFDFRGYKKALDCYRFRNSCEAFWDLLQ